MEIDLDLGQWIVIVLSGFLFIWFILAGSANRKRGIATYRWLRQGLGALGKISNAELIGASNMGARFVVANAARPFRRVEAHYLLEPREFLPYWFFSYFRGKRDEVVIKVALRMTPSGSLEIIRAAGGKNLPAKDRIHPDFQVVHADLDDPQLMDNVETFLRKNGVTVKKIKLQAQVPHIELHARLKPLLDFSPESYFSEILNWYQPS
jgi:hypothetical protein